MKEMLEIIKEYVIRVEGLSFPVKARIMKRSDGYYEWEISHYYKPENGVDFYSPDQQSGDSIQRVETLLSYYVKGMSAVDKGFTTTVKPNPNY